MSRKNNTNQNNMNQNNISQSSLMMQDSNRNGKKRGKMKLGEKQAVAAVLLLSGFLLAGGCTVNPSRLLSKTAETKTELTGSNENESGGKSGTNEVTYSESECTIITLNENSAELSGEGAVSDGSTVTITEEGSYILRGKLTGTVIVDTSKDADVQLILDGVEISCDGIAPIYVKQADKVTVTLADGSVNSIINTGDFVQTDAEEINAAIYSKDDVLINGSGSLSVSSEKGHGIKSSDDVTVAGGDITIEAAKDGIHGKEHVTVDGGTLKIQANEGIEGTIVIINDGDIIIDAADDGINASAKAEELGTPKVEINGGNLTITMAQGDTDGIDSNGDLYINGGTVSVNARFPFDYDGVCEHNGGTVIVNGVETDEITNQFGGMEGGPGGFGGGPGGFGGGFGNFDENGERPENFDPSELPKDFNKGNMPEGFDPGSIPEGFDKGQKPDKTHDKNQNNDRNNSQTTGEKII